MGLHIYGISLYSVLRDLCQHHSFTPRRTPFSWSKDRTGHVALILESSQNVCKLISHIGVPGLLSLEPLCWIFPFLGQLSIPASSHPLSLHLLCLSLWLLTGNQGSSSPFSLASLLLLHRPLFLAQFIGLWGGNSLGSGSSRERESQAKSHSGSHVDLYSVLHLTFIL